MSLVNTTICVIWKDCMPGQIWNAPCWILHGLDPCQQQIILYVLQFGWNKQNIFYSLPTVYLNLLPATLWDKSFLCFYSSWFVPCRAQYQISAHHILTSCFPEPSQRGESHCFWSTEAYIYQRQAMESVGPSRGSSNFHPTISGWVGFGSVIVIVPAHPNFPSHWQHFSSAPHSLWRCLSLSTL